MAIDECRAAAVAAHIAWSRERAALDACTRAVDRLPPGFEDRHPGPLQAALGALDRAARRADDAGDVYRRALAALAGALTGDPEQDPGLRAHLDEWEWDWRGAEDGL